MIDRDAFLASFMAAWNGRRIDDLLRHYAPDAVMEDPTLPEPRRGHAALRAYYEEMFAAYPAAEHGVLRSATQDAALFFEWWFRAPGWRCQGVSVMTIAAGRIVHDVSYWVDTRPAPAAAG